MTSKRNFKESRINGPKTQTTFKIESPKEWSFVKPTVLKYGNYKFYRSSIRNGRTYFRCSGSKEGCKVCLVFKDNNPFRISCFQHNHC